MFFCTQAFGQFSAALFYGEHVPIQELCMYDVVVVDPYSDFNPQTYCNTTSQALAYVSLGEVPTNSPYIKNIRSEWIIGKNKAWNNNHVIDQTQQGWQSFFLNQLIEPLWNKGYRGFFLDTLDSYRLAVDDPKLQQEQINNLANTIHLIKRRHPDAKIILNRGFELLPRIHSDINAVLIESLYNAWHQDKRAYEETPQKERDQLFVEINKIRAMKLPIIIVDYLPPSEKDRAPILADSLAKQGFIPWITDSLLQSIYIKRFPELPRQILIAFTDETKLPIRFGAPLRFVAPIIEYMGYVPKYLNLEEQKELPPGDLSKQYAGIILWLDSDKSNKSLLKWVETQIANKIPVVFLNGFGVPSESEELSKLGLIISPPKPSSASLKIVKIDKHFVGHETEPPIGPYNFRALHAVSSEVLLQMKNSNQQTEDAIAITPWGGYALIPFVIQYLPDYYAKWVLNPFEFFHKALRLKDFPVPDTTTENGRRLMTVHIDGDGFAYPAKWAGGSFAAVALRDKILKEFRSAPKLVRTNKSVGGWPNYKAIKPNRKQMNIFKIIYFVFCD